MAKVKEVLKRRVTIHLKLTVWLKLKHLFNISEPLSALRRVHTHLTMTVGLKLNHLLNLWDSLSAIRRMVLVEIVHECVHALIKPSGLGYMKYPKFLSGGGEKPRGKQKKVCTMFSVVGQALKYFLGGSAEAGLQRDLDEPPEDDINLFDTIEQQRDFHGRVTHIFQNHGLIDNEVYFSFDHVLGAERPAVNDVVYVTAVQHHEGGGWHAKTVTITTDWEEDNDHKDDWDSDIWNITAVEASPTELIGIVTHNENKTGYINDDIFYDLSECQTQGFCPYKGDWVKVLVKNSESFGQKVAESIEPLRILDKEGVISAQLGDHGYIDGEVYFMVEAVISGYRPRKWDPVSYTAVESKQGQCSWRAIKIEPSAQPATTRLQMLTGPLRKSFTEELLADKNDVTVSKETDFGSISFGSTKQLTLCVSNHGDGSQTFQRCHLPASSSQMRIKETFINMAGNQTVVEGPVSLSPGQTLSVTVEMTAKNYGYENQLLILTFETFKVGRYITAEAADDVSIAIHNPTSAPLQEYQGSRVRSGAKRYKESQDKTTPWAVPGQRPQKSKTAVQFWNRIPHYEVDPILRDAVLNHFDLLLEAPVLQEDLCFNNYNERFRVLLHLEEIQMQIDIRDFDQHRVCLRHVGEYLALKVPGLAEGRPSVLIGDKVMLYDPVCPDSICYEGYAHEIFKDEVLLKFTPEFHRTYCGKDYDVEFTFNRGQLRRCHKAIEVALCLQENVLFPTKVAPKPSLLTSVSQRATSSYVVKASGSKVSKGLDLTFFNTRLNSRQRSAVMRMVHGHGRPLPYILFGPPGTGKTVTVVEAILQVFTLLPASRIVACAPSNSAADLLCLRLHESGQLTEADMVRMNAMQRSFKDLPEDIQPYCKFGDDIDLASHYRVLVSTCISVGVLFTKGVRPGHFTHIFIDEAGQATEPEAMVSACLVTNTDGQIILAGDPQQLGPVLQSHHAKTHGLELSFLERLIQRDIYGRDEKKFSNHGAYDPLLVTKLVNNYRSHGDILDLPSQLFYHGELLVDGDQSLTHRFCGWGELPTPHVPVLFHGIRGKDMREGNSPSWFNPMEATQVVRYVQNLINTTDVTCPEIGIITPYRKQVEKIRLLLSSLHVDGVKVGSVEEFQGQERPVIIISTVRSNENMIGWDTRHLLGFLSNAKRFNVAITRAQALLIVTGNPFVLIHDDYWRTFINSCIAKGCYTGCDAPPSAIDL